MFVYRQRTAGPILFWCIISLVGCLRDVGSFVEYDTSDISKISIIKFIYLYVYACRSSCMHVRILACKYVYMKIYLEHCKQDGASTLMFSWVMCLFSQSYYFATSSMHSGIHVCMWAYEHVSMCVWRYTWNTVNKMGRQLWCFVESCVCFLTTSLRQCDGA